MTNKDKCFLAYIAGLIDGEGTISISRQKNYSRNDRKSMKWYWYYRPFIGIAMTDALCLSLIKNYFKKFKTSFWLVEHATPERRHVYRWEVSTQTEAYEFLKLIQPFVINKNEQVRLLKSFIVFLRKWQSSGRKCYDNEFQQKCEYYYRKLKEKHKEPLNGMNSVELLNHLDLRQYRAKPEDIESIKNLLEGVETRLRESMLNKAISVPEKDIVH